MAIRLSKKLQQKTRMKMDMIDAQIRRQQLEVARLRKEKQRKERAA